jgi:DNA polymerase III delta prime subunit
MIVNDDVLWSEKYRPRTVKDTILPETLKNTFLKIIEGGVIPNMTFAGGPGVGKTTIAKALCEEFECDYLVINGSLNGQIDNLRYMIKEFASSVSFSGNRKMIILDEADYLTAATQPALRNFMEEYSNNCGFILTCNYPNRIIDALKSRAPVINFNIERKDAPVLASKFLERIMNILKNEGIEFDTKVVAELISKNFPDWRKTLNILQRYAANGKIDLGILTGMADENFKTLVSHVKKKDFTSMRKWVGENADIEPNIIFRKFYDTAYELVEPQSIPLLVITLNKYDYQTAFVVDKEINITACMVEIMSDIEFK